MTADTAVLFVLATQVSKQGQLTYAKALSGTFTHIGLGNQPLLSFAAALRAAGAARTLLQWAEPEVELSAVCEGDTHRGDSELAHPKGRRGDPFTPSKLVVVTGALTEKIASPLRTAEALPLPHGDHHPRR